MPDNKSNPKQIPNPDDENELIDNPDYDPSKNEDGTDIVKDDLAPIKDKLNKAYGERDELKNKLADANKKLREAELEKLKSEGKEKEHFEAIISDRDDEIATLKAEIVELTRDNAVQKALGTYKFRNERAANLAVSSVTDELVQDDKGKWVHKSGKSIKDFVKSFAEDSDNEFLFEVKENRGSQTKTGDKPSNPSGNGKLRGMTQSQVLQLAAEGKLPSRK